LVPAQTFVATLEAVTQAGGKPVLVDIGEADYNIDPSAAEAALTERTRALVPVHLYGQLADMEQLAQLAMRGGGIPIVEDAAQAHGALREGWKAGAGGTVGVFSFYPAKNLGALGDAGGATTNDPDLAARLRALREHGQRRKYEHTREGYTARLDTIHALALLHKLPLLDGWNDKRRAAAGFYEHHLTELGDIRLPPVAPKSQPVWHLYVIRTARPDELAGFLAERGIATGRHYPTPVHLTGAFEHLGYPVGSFPAAEALAAEGLSLPVFPGISERQLESVVAAVSQYFAARA
jgi:dTDP-4-amino-4,6-dideoxygalactose transaminase